MGASDKRSHQTLTKRKNESANEPKTRKRQRSKTEEEKVKDCGGSEEVKVKYPHVDLETDGKTERELVLPESTAPTTALGIITQYYRTVYIRDGNGWFCIIAIHKEISVFSFNSICLLRTSKRRICK